MEEKSIVPSKRRRSGDSFYHGINVSGNARVHNGDHYGDATYNITYHDKATPDLHTQILDSLWFDSMDARRDNIKGAAPDTLDWIYERRQEVTIEGEGHVKDNKVDSTTTGIRLPEWDNIATWLEEESSTYWVSGKAGTGKSTLMAHISDDHRTTDLLSTWGQDKQLHILTFFFWRPGTELQKSINGLLRTLLYQLCAEDETTIAKIAKPTTSKRNRRGAWTDERLIAAILEVLSTSPHMFCIFLDGLDEYEGETYALTHLIAKIEALPNVKICVSSRPESELTAVFSTCKQLRLERLNRSGIESFVEMRLEPHAHAAAFRENRYWTFNDFVGEIVDRADGVFLWVVLVLPSLSKGLASGDSIGMLSNRLKSMPTEMSDLYALLFSKVDKEHQVSLGFYLVLMRLCKDSGQELNIAQLAATATVEKDPITSYDHFHQICEDEKLRVVGQSAGLLHVATEAFVYKERGASIAFDVPQLRDESFDQDVSLADSTATAKSRDTRSIDDIDLATIRDEHSIVEWVHRSAHEFVFPIDGTDAPFKYAFAELEDIRRIHRRFLLGCLSLLAFGISYEDGSFRTRTSTRLRSILLNCEVVFDESPALASELLDWTRAVVSEVASVEFPNSHTHEVCPPCSRKAISTSPYWEELVTRMRKLSLVQVQLPSLIASPTTNALLIPLFCRLLMDRPEAEQLTVYHTIAKAISKNIVESDSQAGQRMALSVRLFFCDSALGIFLLPECGERFVHVSCVHLDTTRATLALEYQCLAHICTRMIDEKESSPAMSALWSDHFENIAKDTDLFMDLTLSAKSEDMLWDQRSEPTCHRLLLQMSYRLVEALRDGVPHSAIDHQEDLRLVCIPAGRHKVTPPLGEIWPYFGEETGFFVVKPSSSTSLRLLHDIFQLEYSGPANLLLPVNDPLLVNRWSGLLENDVWENTQGLDATRQLFALSCVKLGMRRWSQVKTKDWH